MFEKNILQILASFISGGGIVYFVKELKMFFSPYLQDKETFEKVKTLIKNIQLGKTEQIDTLL